jgi:hypothetical protein
MNEEQRESVFRRWLPGIGLVILTIALLFFFKSHDQDITTLVEEGRQELISYLQDLKPIIFKTEYNTEDVFNFAFYQKLPLDREDDKILQLEESSDRTRNYSIIPAADFQQPYSYKEFLEYVDADKKEKEKIDSILSSYIDDLSSAILYNEQNTLAVNSDLYLLNKAILADIYSYLHKTENKKVAGILPNNFGVSNNSGLKKMIPPKLPDHQNEFIVLTPDTAFKQQLSLDYQPSKVEEEEFEKNMAKLKERMKSLKISIAMNDNELFDETEKDSLKEKLKSLAKGRKRIVQDYSSKHYDSEVDSIIVRVNKITDKIKDMKFSFMADSVNKQFNFKIDKEGAKVFEMNLDMSGLDSAMKELSKNITKQNLERLKKFREMKEIYKVPDSINQKYIDSLMNKKNFNFEK